jgi:hypothetical protein
MRPFGGCVIQALPSFRDRLPVIVDEVTTLYQPGGMIDLIAIERGIAINRLGNRGPQAWSTWRRRCFMGDKGKKDKDKGQKQKATHKDEEAKRQQDKLPKRKA